MSYIWPPRGRWPLRSPRRENPEAVKCRLNHMEQVGHVGVTSNEDVTNGVRIEKNSEIQFIV